MYTVLINALRLGGGAGDSEEVKKHSFFDPISFKELYDKKVRIEAVQVHQQSLLAVHQHLL